VAGDRSRTNEGADGATTSIEDPVEAEVVGGSRLSSTRMAHAEGTKFVPGAVQAAANVGTEPGGDMARWDDIGSASM
jgi:hypothetical protein